MSKQKYPFTQSMRLSRETMHILDSISEEFGDVSRRVAIELLCRFAEDTCKRAGISYRSLLLKDTTPESTSVFLELDRRRKVPPVVTGAL